MMESVFNFSRLELARQRRGLSKRELAEKLNLNERTLSNWYASEIVQDHMAYRISAVLDFPESFFYGKDLDEVSIDSVSFRGQAKTTIRKKNIVISEAILAGLLNDWIDQHFELPKEDVPDLHELRYDFSDEGLANEYDYLNSESEDDDGCRNPAYAEACAEVVRKTWGLGELPVPNIISLLESKGIRVFSLSQEVEEVDACCAWSKNRPCIFLNMSKTAERCRFDAAHELGHLVMHRHGVSQGRQIEQEANAFASAFLMPRRSLLASPPRNPDLRAITLRKKTWKVSAKALVHRYHKLGLISDWNAIKIYQQLAKHGKSYEPESIAHETSLLIPKVFNALEAESIYPSDVAQAISINFKDFSSMTFKIPQELANKRKESLVKKLRVLT